MQGVKMEKIVDAVGKACPIPVVMSKKAIDEGADEFIVKVDNKIAVENLKKLANSTAFLTEVKEEDGIYYISFSKDCKECSEMLKEISEPQQLNNNVMNDFAVFVGKEWIGDGDHELGKNLMRMYFFTLTESKELPSSILFMNGGVKLPTEDEQVIEHLMKLKDKGVEILVCGTCLNFYGIADKLKIGTVSNMYDISEKMLESHKVITL